MNLKLLNPFENDFPEVIASYINANASVCAFNRRGTLLAVGCHDGKCVIYDFDTRSIARTLNGHARPVASISWSNSGRKLLSSASDYTVKLWDVQSGNVDNIIRFDSAIMFAQLHPKDPTKCVICPLMQQPVLCDLTSGKKHELPQYLPDAGKANNKPKSGAVPKKNSWGFAAFDKEGKTIWRAGSAKGILTAIDTVSMKIVEHIKVSNTPIKSIEFSKNGQYALIISTDKIIRCYKTDSYSLSGKFQDAVNKMQWKKCCFSCDNNSDYIIGGSAQKAQHKIYIWNRGFGQLIKILEGPKEGIMDLVWHPLRPIIASVSTNGIVYIWSTNYTENWSAFAPDFTELEENEVYNEREDEFDIAEDDEIVNGVSALEKAGDNDEDIDITTIEKIVAYSSDEEDDLWFIPVDPVPDNIAPQPAQPPQVVLQEPLRKKQKTQQ
eukprot:TRINITY_DN2102_c0_g3_i1.p1 TRINITY_DN2102_c0_g3~~TRINITY_DN2102_c0_g3_i1.p1  ORF type:complete len:438 (-),score=67.61 TRINITY_DN2102_c0_g3_i1:913-2226(-)